MTASNNHRSLKLTAESILRCAGVSPKAKAEILALTIQGHPEREPVIRQAFAAVKLEMPNL